MHVIRAMRSSKLLFDLRSIQLITLLLACISFSCNQVKELQEPDPFASSEDLPAISIQSFADSVEINVLQANHINVPVSVEFEKPAHGLIVIKEKTQQFFYIPDRSFFGTDSIRYNLCRDISCRRGQILVEKQKDPSRCYPVYSSPDTAIVNLISGPGSKSIPLFPGDVYCNGNVRTISQSYPGLNNFTISDSLRFYCSYSRIQKRSFLLSYSNSDQYLGVRNRYIRLNLIPDNNYCDGIFEVDNRKGPPLTLEREDSLLVSGNSFNSSIKACEGDIDTSFFQLYASPNLILKSLSGRRFVIYPRPMTQPGPAKLTYRYRNIRGITDFGEMRIFIHH